MKSSAPVYKRCRPLMGTFVEISLLQKKSGTISPSFERVVNKAFEAIDEVSFLMSFHDKKSDLSRLNRAPVGRWVKINSKLIEVLELALQMQNQSDGLFNVAIGNPLVHWNFLPGQAKSPGFNHLGFIGFEVRRPGKARRLLPIKIDLGGIAKGYAVDRAVEAIKKITRAPGCVNAGGDLRVFGDWSQNVRIRVKGPQQHFTQIYKKSLATSEIIPRRSRSPYVDTQKGRLVVAKKAAIVVADTCAVADALTKVVLLAPLPLAKKIAKAHGAKFAILGQA